MKFNNDTDAVTQLRALACLINVPHASLRDVETTQVLCRRLEEIIGYMEATGRTELGFDLRRFWNMIKETMKDFRERSQGVDPFQSELTFSQARFDNYWHDVLGELEGMRKS